MPVISLHLKQKSKILVCSILDSCQFTSDLNNNSHSYMETEVPSMTELLSALLVNKVKASLNPLFALLHCYC